MLRPYATKPSSNVAARYQAPGIVSFIVRATAKEPSPEKIPLSTTISYVLLEEMLLVQLFSKPQQTVAASTKREPYENLKLSVPSNESRILDRVISTIAVHSLFETASLKINNAIIVVTTISKLPRSDAFAEVP